MWLGEWIGARAHAGPSGQLRGHDGVIRLADLAHGSALEAPLEELRGRVVLVAAHQQFTAALALIELDGVARRIVLCPPDLDAVHLPAVIRDAEADTCVHDLAQPPLNASQITLSTTVRSALQRSTINRRSWQETEWILLTSGTSGAPKLVLHTLASLTSAFVQQPRSSEPVVWSTFYDIRRYGGLQILLRALHDGAMVLSDAGESISDFLARAASSAVTHISGTASHWRAVLMSGAAARIAPRYVRLSGEIADQAILDALKSTYPGARVAHAYASTEAGVAFEVGDGLAGFPAQLASDFAAEASGSGVEIRIAGDSPAEAAGVGAVTAAGTAGTLQVRSAGTALRYLGPDAPLLHNGDGFVDNGDRVELRAERYYFVGRSGGVINVGGLKVHPEEVEAVINSHPWVRMSLVKARRSPITGAVVTAEVVLAEAADRPADAVLSEQIRETCRRALPAHKVPATIRVVAALPVSAAGKLVRPNA